MGQVRKPKGRRDHTPPQPLPKPNPLGSPLLSTSGSEDETPDSKGPGKRSVVASPPQATVDRTQRQSGGKKTGTSRQPKRPGQTGGKRTGERK